ncbi:hypothetical protein CC86DRAFT_407119 [Ophiobolus disseminans]|uniref:Uncharacterized protein n=1 Tax=Ophiobolus disseminans TaxID=1469910 RepID=A0A6A6ZZB4_9PLEO|nr:hypothetical protein CC86DRAFT_407119 [Ophiobolus disseminans]
MLKAFLVREISRSYHDAARGFVMLGRTRMALKWAEKELESNRIYVSEDHPDFPEELEFVQKLSAAVKTEQPVNESVIQWLDSQDSGAACVVM